MAATIRASTLVSYGEVARSLGLNPAVMLRRVGLDPQALTNPDIRLRAKAFGDLLELSAAETGCETFGLRMAARRRPSDFGALSLLMTHQPTLRAVLETALRYSPLINDTLSLTIEEADGIAVVREELLAGRPGVARQAHELTVGVIVRLFRSVVGDAWRPLSVSFVHPAPEDVTEHRRLLGDGVRFGGAFNGIVCEARDLDRPTPGADPVLAAYAARLVDAVAVGPDRSEVQAVRRAIADLLPAGRASLDQVAARLGLGARTLQRRLEGEGVAFRGLLEEVRSTLARQYVEADDRPMIEVAHLLGYSQPAAFSRWFRGCFGRSPTTARLDVQRRRAAAKS